MWILLFILSLCPLLSQQNSCPSENILDSRSIYSIGDTLSVEDQNILFPVCNGSDNYLSGDLFSFSDINGDTNGGDYKISIISMNATWWPACYDYISLMDQLIEVISEYEEIQFIVSLDYSTNEADLYSCSEWADLYTELGNYGNDPLILDTDPEHNIWNMFAASTYSAYAFIDHNMVLRYKFDMPNLYDFQFNYIPELVNAMYGCTDINACNYDETSVINDDSCQYNNECTNCDNAENQLSCMDLDGCMWMGDHCMESSDGCMNFDNELDCIGDNGCYWMGNHCMAGSSCMDPIAFNYNPIADVLETGDNNACQYSSFINFGCIYPEAVNFDSSANVDDGSCEYIFADLNSDGIINVLDIVQLVSIILD